MDTIGSKFADNVIDSGLGIVARKLGYEQQTLNLFYIGIVLQCLQISFLRLPDSVML
jgi:hypothetical protein